MDLSNFFAILDIPIPLTCTPRLQNSLILSPKLLLQYCNAFLLKFNRLLDIRNIIMQRSQCRKNDGRMEMVGAIDPRRNVQSHKQTHYSVSILPLRLVYSAQVHMHHDYFRVALAVGKFC